MNIRTTDAERSGARRNDVACTRDRSAERREMLLLATIVTGLAAAASGLFWLISTVLR